MHIKQDMIRKGLEGQKITAASGSSKLSRVSSSCDTWSVVLGLSASLLLPWYLFIQSLGGRQEGREGELGACNGEGMMGHELTRTQQYWPPRGAVGQ